MTHVLVVDDDAFFQDLIQATLTPYQLTPALSGAAALEASRRQHWDLIILDVDLGDLDGYAVCEQLRTQGLTAPILFVSALTSTDNRLKAYGCGANDYLTKPYQQDELRHKAGSLIATHRDKRELAEQLDVRAKIITDSQTESYHLQAVNEFVQLSTQCKNVERLSRLFFLTLKRLDCSGLLMLHDGSREIRSDDGHVTRLEADILAVAEQLPRIHAFGNNRGLFNWQCATLMVRNIGPLIDVLAILMDALEQALEDIALQDRLLSEITEIEQASAQYQQRMEGLMRDMTLALQDSLLTLGLTASLSEEEEAQISEIVHYYSQQMQAPLQAQQQHNQILKQLIEQLRTPSTRLLTHLDKGEEDDSSVELF